MKTYRLVYNPYTVETKLYAVKGDNQLQPVGEGSSLAPIFHQRMQKWLAPHDQWKGFFAELKDMCGESRVKLLFVGTEEDYSDLVAAGRQYASTPSFTVEVVSVLPKAAQAKVSGQSKLGQVQQMLRDAKEADLLPEDVVNSLDKALDPYFEINVTAPVSAGKSTLQNALIGRRLLPTSNQAKTAVLTRTRINNSLSDFRAKSLLHDGTWQVHKEPVTQSLINKLNDEKDPKDPSNLAALRDTIYLEGPSSQFEDCLLDLVFVDTPGGNNAMNQRHKDVMRNALFAESKNVILFVFSYATISHEDTMQALREAAEAMNSGLNGKMNQDRFLFVCTGCDLIPDNLDSTEIDVRKVLSACGITEPNLFMVSAVTAELLRTQEYNQRMVRAGKRELCEELNDKERNVLESCIKQLALPACDMYAHAAISEDKKRELGEEIARLREAYMERDAYLRDVKNGYVSCSPERYVEISRELEEIGKKLALLNSGIPGLESAIREYLNRYAIPMKIQQASESIRAKVEEAEMLQKTMDKWACSETEAEAAKIEVDRCKDEVDKSQTLRNDRARLAALKLDKNAINQKSSRCLRQLDELSNPPTEHAKYLQIGNKEGNWIRKSDAMRYLNDVNQSLFSHMEPIVSEITDYFNDTVVETCNQIMEDYRAHIDALRSKGTFNLAGLDIEKIIAATPKLANSIYLNAMVKNRSEIVGSKLVPKKGLLNAIKQLFGVSSGYEKTTVYGNVEYVFILDIFTTQKGKMVSAYHKMVNEETKSLEQKLESLRKDVAERMDSLDSFIKQIYDEYSQKLSNHAELQAEAKKLGEQHRWLQDFMDRVNRLLDVESVESAGKQNGKG